MAEVDRTLETRLPPARVPLDMPLTERALLELGPPRVIWILVWGALPFVVAALAWTLVGSWGMPSRTGPVAEPGRLVNTVLWSYVTLLSLWAVGRTWRAIERLRSAIAHLTDDPGFDPFAGTGRTAVPLLLALGLSGVYSVPDLLGHSPTVAAILLPFEVVANLPAVTSVWVHLVVFAGLDRLGRHRLALAPFELDRSLGLAPFGRLAFSTFLFFPAVTIPFLAFGRWGVVDVVVNVAVLVIGVPLFFLTSWRLRQHLLAAKRRHVAEARDAYARAFAPIEGDPGVAMMGQRALLLMAAETVERRAAEIQEWPFNDSIIRTVAAITSSVLTAIVTRLIVTRLGL